MNPDSNDFCVDCGIDTILIGEYYMVKPEIWQKSGLGPRDGMLCITCLEERLGHQLCSYHFSDLPVNIAPRLFRSEKLLSRLAFKGL
jgi:hypothetical protein